MLRSWSLIVLTFVWLMSGLGFPASSGSTKDALGQVRFIHLANHAPLSVDVYLDDMLMVEAFTLGEVSAWRATHAGDYRVELVIPSGERSVYALTVQAGAWLSVVLVELTDSADNANNGLQITVIEEDYSPLNDDTARLTLIYALPAPHTGETLLDDLAISDGLTPYQTLIVDSPAGLYALTLAGEGDGTPPVYDFNGVDLLAETNHLFVVFGDSSAPRSLNIPTPVSPRASTSENTGDTALIRVAHLSSGTPQLDVYLNDELFEFGALRFPEFTSWQVYPSGIYLVTVTLAGDPPDQPLIPPQEIEFTEGLYHNLFVIGAQFNDTLGLHRVAEIFTEITQGNIQVSFFNAHPGTGSVSIYSLEEELLVEQLGYPGFFGGNDGFTQVILPAGVYDFDLIQDSTGTRVVEIENRNLLAGRNYLIAIINADPPFFFTFSDVGEVFDLMGVERGE